MKYYKLIFWNLMVVCTVSFAEIIRHSHLQEIFEYVEKFKAKQHLYIFFDIDDTILSTALGSRRTVEPRTKEIVDHLKNRGFNIHGLTARSIYQHTYTNELLKNVGISFNSYPNLPHLIGSADVGYCNGVFYCGAVAKGFILRQLFMHRASDDSVGIIFVDDLRHESVEQMAQELNLECICVHYTHAQDFINHRR